MPIVIALDTSALEAERYDFANSRALAGLIKSVRSGEATVLLTTVTNSEVERHLKSFAEKAHRQLRVAATALKERDASPARSTGLVDIDRFLKELDAASIDKLQARLQEQWSKFKTQIRANVISVGGVDVEKIFNRYFNGEPPFSQAKPREFPDAFVVEALQAWAKEHGSVHVVSTDPDIRNACDGTSLVHVERIGHAIEQATSRAEKDRAELLSAVKDFFVNFKGVFVEKLEGAIESLGITIQEDWNADINSVEVADIRDLKFDVVRLGRTEAEITGSAEIALSVEATVGDYGSSPVEDGDYVVVYQNEVAYSLTRAIEFYATIQVRKQRGGRKPVSFREVGVIEPQRIEIVEEDDAEILKSWKDDMEPDPEEPDFFYRDEDVPADDEEPTGEPNIE